MRVPGGIVNFVMIDAEYTKPNGRRANSGDLRAKKARRHAGLTMKAVNAWRLGIESIQH
ncbi:MAG: hypothetical protein JOZ32_12290 [Bryobacterales bacterium]|nr:hypothetical protein [Bryobacterales bacterium]